MGTHSQPVVLFLLFFFLIHKSLCHFVIKFSTAQLGVLSGTPPGSASPDSPLVAGAACSLLPGQPDCLGAYEAVGGTHSEEGEAGLLRSSI